MFLERIVAAKQEEVAVYRNHISLSELKKQAAEMPPARDFLRTVKSERQNESAKVDGERAVGSFRNSRLAADVGTGVKLIAEIKKASPSRGVLCREFNPCQIADIYQQAGASAISVVTDVRFFQGHPVDLSSVRKVTSLPLLRKDFIIDEYQIYQSRCLGADAVLLITALLGQRQLVEYIGLAEELGMAALVEVHTHDELSLVLETEAVLIGINNRDLHTFQVDLATTYRLISAIPQERVVVSESGIKSRDDVVELARVGVDAVLVGEALMRAKDIGALAAELIGHRR